ncbi:hypothetical protein [Halorientalis sp.]|jgi:hypothetical protein|uniref:hypothetical protein n=1 Tax=Halorientalis sp. TaxID=1931229 RepID=UPI0026184539|nr:hypothetical protein [Halorientalis sp.]
MGFVLDEHGLTALDSGARSTLSAELRVTGSGRIWAFRYDVHGTNRLDNQVRFTVSLRYSVAGSATVTEPGWTTEVE